MTAALIRPLSVAAVGRGRGIPHQAGWTPERVAELIALRDAGKTVAEIVLLLGGGVTTDGVKTKIRALNLPRVKINSEWTKAKVATLRRLWADGKTAREIAEELGDVSREAVLGKAHRIGLASRIGRPVSSHPRPRAQRQVSAVAVKRGGNVSFRRLPVKDLAPAAVDVAITTAPDSSLSVSIMDVRRHHCRWPIGNPADIWNFRYCGGDANGDRAYCAFHAKLAYQPAATKRKRMSDETREKIRISALRRWRTGQARAGL